jgi:hypothetical protein
MGAHDYWYFVNHKPDIDEALQELREREFQAGRYFPVTAFPEFPVGPDSPSPGAGHTSIKKAIRDAGETGTRSILDIQTIAAEPDFCVAAPVPEELLHSHYGTTQPTRPMIENNMEFLDEVERGHCVYIIAYKNGKPDEILFAGYSFD